jgi:hypothetical protein
MYECIQVHSYHEHDSVLNEEGDLDNESEDSDFEMEMMNKKTRKIQNRESISSTSSTTARYGSPMSVDERDDVK